MEANTNFNDTNCDIIEDQNEIEDNNTTPIAIYTIS